MKKTDVDPRKLTEWKFITQATDRCGGSILLWINRTDWKNSGDPSPSHGNGGNNLNCLWTGEVKWAASPYPTIQKNKWGPVLKAGT